MSGVRKGLLAVSILILLYFAGGWLKDELLLYLMFRGNPPTAAMLYPAAPSMPAVVNASMDELLQKIDQHLKTSAPWVLEFLQPGLSDEQLTQIETENKLQLSPDVKALYKWHNGCRAPKGGDAFYMTRGPIPGKYFMSLDEALRLNATMRAEQKKATGVAKRAYETLVGHRESWITVYSDGSGDGYFYDPKRKDTEGAVFYCFAESGEYIFFPSMKNLFAAIEKCYALGLFKTVGRGEISDMEEDYERSQAVWKEFGAECVIH